MSGLLLFDKVYESALKRGHVVHAAAIGMQQLGICHGGSTKGAYAAYRLAEQMVDAAEEFLDAVKPYFRDTIKTQDGRKFKIVTPVCHVCGHPYCELYMLAGTLPMKMMPLHVHPIG